MPRRRVKSLLGRAVYYLRLHRRLLEDRGLIVAFHQVNDDERRGTTACTSATFRRFCEFLQRYFTVVSLSEFLERLKSGKSVAELAVITFDDGYEDNIAVAAPILKELELPATFFVTTDFIGSRTQTFWDTTDGVESKWMTWDDVRALNRGAFTIGCHTCSHVDLGKADVDLARSEIEMSKEKLSVELAAPVTHFAYPFGGPSNIRPETLDLVKCAHFDCCLSCHGGLVRAGQDPFSLPREPITNWHVSPYQFGLELLFRD